MSTPLQFDKLIKKIEGLEGQAGRNISHNYAQALREMRNIVREKYAKYAVDGELTFAEMNKYNRRKKLNKEVQQAMKDLWVENGADTRKTLRSIYKTSFEDTKLLVEETASQVVRGKYKREMAQQALQNPISGLTLNERLSRRRRDIITRIQETLTQGIMDNETYTQMSSRLKDELESDYKKAMRIIRTEGHRVQEQGKRESLEYAVNQGIEMWKYWISSADERVRDSHEHMGEKYSEDNAISIDDDFVSDETGASGPTPGQLGEASEDINCRCVTGYVVVTDE